MIQGGSKKLQGTNGTGELGGANGTGKLVGTWYQETPGGQMAATNFPSARNNQQKRYCLRLLQKTLKPGVFDVAMIVAQLCFWKEEQDGKLQYTHE